MEKIEKLKDKITILREKVREQRQLSVKVGALERRTSDDRKQM